MRTISRKYCIHFAFALLALACMGCGTLEGKIAIGVASATVAGARTPTHEIEQIYYLGIFDPQEQVPPEVYRIRVHGQSSILSGVKFGSGWVPASLVDSLGTTIEYNDNASRVTISKGSPEELASLQTGRRMILFGPEGFREAPKDHRLVIVMGASPDKYFNAVDKSLQVVSQAMKEQRHEVLNKRLLEVLTKTKEERDQIDSLAKQIANDVKPEGAVQ